MKCSEIRKLLPELALGDLDAEPARRAEGHLGGCAACRSEFEAVGRASAALRRAAALAPSTERRDRAVEAMARAASERPAVRRPRRARLLAGGAAAAAALVAAGALLLGRASGADEFRVAEVSGRAVAVRPDGSSEPLRPGAALAPGARVVTEAGAEVTFDLGRGTLRLGGDASMTLASPLKVVLDRGDVRADLRERLREALVVTDLGSNFVAIRHGRVEAGIREVKGLVGAAQEERGVGEAHLPGAQASAPARRLVVLRAEGDVDGSYQWRLAPGPAER
jgi:hypothetical protein